MSMVYVLEGGCHGEDYMGLGVYTSPEAAMSAFVHGLEGRGDYYDANEGRGRCPLAEMQWRLTEDEDPPTWVNDGAGDDTGIVRGYELEGEK